VSETKEKHLKLFEQEAERLDDVLRSAKKKEVKTNKVRYHSEDEDESDEEKETKKSSTFFERRKGRKENRDDSISNVIYQSENPQFSDFTYNPNPLYQS